MSVDTHATISFIEYFATGIFAIAIIHTFVSAKIGHLAHKFTKDSPMERLLHLLGEVEIVFGLWAAVFLIVMDFVVGIDETVHYVESLDFTEPAFVFVIMVMAATRPVLYAASSIINAISRLLPFSRPISFYLSVLIIGPLLGSFITEPAAMTVTAMILLKNFYSQSSSRRFRYTTMAALLVNISIGGTLTHFAAPPVLMVAETWHWDLLFMLRNFGYKSAIATVLIAIFTTWKLKNEIQGFEISLDQADSTNKPHPPYWLIISHIFFLFATVYMAHHISVFIGIFLLFMGLTIVTHLYQTSLQYDKSLLVALFLGGLVVLGRMQAWWIDPILDDLTAQVLFTSATLLTAITDNAALTYLGSQVPNLTDELKYALVAGAVTGGGLTVIANAPNPAGFSILKGTFRDKVINPGTLLLYSIVPTTIAAICLWILP